MPSHATVGTTAADAAQAARVTAGIRGLEKQCLVYYAVDRVVVMVKISNSTPSLCSRLRRRQQPTLATE